jgi:hypothetical protein
MNNRRWGFPNVLRIAIAALAVVATLPAYRWQI